MPEDLRLLVPAEADDVGLALGGRRWHIRVFENAAAAPPYTCVSYSCGPHVVPNPLDASQSVSDRALPGLETVVRSVDTQALWIDGFCIPPDEPARSTILRQLGRVYAGAELVVVVLSAGCSRLLAKVAEEGSVDDQALTALEADEWVSRAWTYQEIANSRALRFVAEGQGVPAVPGDDVLNHVGMAIDRTKAAHGWNSFEYRVRSPRLDGLEDVIADWMSADLMQRSAFRVLADMSRRESRTLDERYFAMIGAITAAAMDNVGSPAEQFLAACEDKGDYSFIFVDAPRRAEAGVRWRPVLGDDLRAVFAWHSWGERQPGARASDHLHLDAVVPLAPGPLRDDARDFIGRRVGAEGRTAGELADRVFERFSMAGFRGRLGSCLVCESGLFFPTVSAGPGDVPFASTAIRYAFGAPALLVGPAVAEVHPFVGVGVFVGLVPATGAGLRVS